MTSPLSPTRIQLIAMLGELVAAAAKLTATGTPSPEQRAFRKAVGKLNKDMQQWPDENFSFEDGIVYVILDRMERLESGRPLLASSMEAAEKYCRARIEQEYGEGRALVSDRSLGGVTALYANGNECFNIMQETLVG